METLLESRLWKFAMVWGALSAVLGGLILAWPGASILVASTLFGVYLLLSGFAGVAMSFTLPESAGMKVMLFISGVLSVIMAVLCFRNFGTPYPVLLLSIWIGVSFVVQGFSIVAVAISYQALPARGWYAFAWRLVGDRRRYRPRLAVGFDRRAHVDDRCVAGRDGDRRDRVGDSRCAAIPRPCARLEMWCASTLARPSRQADRVTAN